MPQLPLTTSCWPADTTPPVLPTTIGGALRTAASRVPGQVALIAGSPDPARRREWTYDELLAEAERGARALRDRFGPGEPELTALCRRQLAAVKMPVRWLFTGGFPLTATGKVRKDVLSAWLADQPGRAPARRQAGDSVAAHADGGPQC